MNRRSFLGGLAGILAAGAAPAIITTPGLLMPVRKIIVPDTPGTIMADMIDRWVNEVREITGLRAYSVGDIIQISGVRGMFPARCVVAGTDATAGWAKL
jgi:hypothetical protein